MTLIRLGDSDPQNIEQLCHSKQQVRQKFHQVLVRYFKMIAPCPGFSS